MRVDIGWCLSFYTAVHRVHVGQQIAQPEVGDVVGNKFVGRPKEMLAVLRQTGARRPKIECIHLVGYIVECVNIFMKLTLLMRKVFSQTLDEGVAY